MPSYLGWKLVWVLKYKGIKFGNNNSLVQCIDQLTTETVHEIIEISKDQNNLPKFCIWSLYDSLMMNILYIILLSRLIER